MPRRKKTISNAPDLVPILITEPGGGKRCVIMTRPEEVNTFLDIQSNLTRMSIEATKKTTSRRMATDRFQQGLLLLAWIRHEGGTLTKRLVNDIKRHCKDWRPVRAYEEHHSVEKSRSALRALAADTKAALSDGRLPPGWKTAP